jgi:hypothetical protein
MKGTTMIKITLLAASLLLLAACETEEEQRGRIEKALPKGCRMVDLGSYKSIDHLVMIDCPTGYTMNGMERQWTGKAYVEHNFAAFSPK